MEVNSDIGEVEKEDDNYVITKLEKFDKDFLHKLLRKEGWEYEDNYFENPNAEPGMSIANLDYSVDDKLSAIVNKRSQSRGDLSPYRNSIMHKKNIPKQISKEAISQMSLRENISKRFGKEDSFITPNKLGDRYSINFTRNREMASVMQLNWLHVAMAQDTNIDYSASRRKSMRIFSQRKSKFDSRSDFSNPIAIEESKTRKRIASSMSPKSQKNQVNQNSMGKDIENQNATMTNVKAQEKQERFSDRISPREQPYIHRDDVLKEVSEADEDEKHANTPQNKRPEAESNVRLKEAPKSMDKKTVNKEEDLRKKASQDIDIRIEDNW